METFDLALAVDRGRAIGSTPPMPMPADPKNDPKPGKNRINGRPLLSKESSPCFLPVFSLLLAFGEIYLSPESLSVIARSCSIALPVFLGKSPLYGAFFVSSGFRAAHLSFLIGFFVRPGVPFLRPDPQYCKGRRAQELSRLAVAPTLRRTPPLPGHALTASSTTARTWCGRDDDQRGARFPGADQSRHDLVSGGSRTRTMMHSCASAAKLRGGGPHSVSRHESQGRLSGPRHLEPSSAPSRA